MTTGVARRNSAQPVSTAPPALSADTSAAAPSAMDVRSEARRVRELRPADEPRERSPLRSVRARVTDRVLAGNIRGRCSRPGRSAYQPLLLKESWLYPGGGLKPRLSFFGKPATWKPLPGPWLCV